MNTLARRSIRWPIQLTCLRNPDARNTDTYYWYSRTAGNAYLILFHCDTVLCLSGGTNSNFLNFVGTAAGGNENWYHPSHMLVR